MDSSVINLRDLGISETQAAEARARLAPFAAEWDRPEMSIYDDYNFACSQKNQSAHQNLCHPEWSVTESKDVGRRRGITASSHESD